MKKKIALITILFLNILILSKFSTVQADTASKTLAIKMLRESGYGYQLNKSGNSSGIGKNIWKIYEPNGNSNDIFYCIRGGPGFGSTNMDGDGTAATTYNYSADFKDKSKIADYISKLSLSDQNYNSLLWVLDNCAIDEQSRTNLLANAKISSNNITADDIDAVQQVVIWHYTNQSDAYQVTGTFDFWLNTVKGEKNSTYQSLSDFDNIDGMSGWTRAEKCQELYDYFIENADKATGSSSSTSANVKFDDSKMDWHITSQSTILGPFRIESNVPLEGSISVTDQNGNALQLAQDVNGTPIPNGTTSNDLVGKDFYVIVPITQLIGRLNIRGIEYSRDVNSIIYWAPTANITSQDQPVVQIKKEKVNSVFVGDIPIYDRPDKYSLELIKIDEKDENVKLQGAEFEVTLPDGIKKTCTTDNTGKLTIPNIVMTKNLQPETITIKETKAPEGYKKYEDTITLIVTFIRKYNKSYVDTVTMNGKTLTTNIQETVTEDGMINGSAGSELIKLQMKNKKNIFDLSLRKFITAVENEGKTTNYTREPNPVDVTPLKNGGSTTAIYNHPKNPIKVAKENIVTYTIRVYNEGQLDGYVEEITDHLPEQLEFLEQDPLNVQYGWEKVNERTIKTTVTGKNSEKASELYKDREGGTLLKAFDGGTTLNYIDVQIRCKVKNTAVANQKMTNIAQITKFADSEGNPITDRDSQANNINLPTDNDLPNYNDEKINNGDKYIPGQQDDDDFEKIILDETKIFDLSLRKFITEVEEPGKNNEEGKKTSYNREPNPVDTTPLTNGGSETTAYYNHTKTPIRVEKENIVTYTIRVYNEGDIDGYVEEITDHLPEELEFLAQDPINIKYGWEKVNERTIKTTITGKNSEKGKELYKDREGITLLKAFDRKTSLNYIDVQIRCKVKNTAKVKQKITNIAQITKFTDSEGNTITDRDSQANNINLPTDSELPNYNDEKTNKGDKYIPGQQDDDDFEKVLVEEKIFDLALRKFITSINGKAPEKDRTPQIDETEINKLKNQDTTTANKVHPKNALKVKTGDKVIYTIRIYNEGERAGYATEVTDYLPNGLKLADNSEINQAYGWKNPSGDGRTIVTNYLSDKLLKEFNGEKIDSVDLQIECEVIAKVGEQNQSLKNIAEITQDRDENGNPVDDIDSDPNNVKKEEYGEKSQEDDDDFEHLILEGKYFDLSLRKFISTIETNAGVKNYDRAPTVDVTPLVNGSSTTAIYNHPKYPIGVASGNIVTYTIRVYNEGQIDGYVREITDHLPKQLEFLTSDPLNIKYGWEISEDGRTVKTTITSPNTKYSANRDEIYKDREGATLLKAFDGIKLDYIDVRIKCKVKSNVNLDEKITNIADITDYADDNGNKIKDRDSQENNVNIPSDDNLPTYKDEQINKGDEYIPGQQDDDDFEKLVLQKFDLSLRKFITGVDDKEITNRVPIFNKTSDNKYTYEHPKNPVDVATGNIVYYTLRIFNEGNVSGYASEIKDNLPEGLEFLPEHELNKQYRWKMYKEDGAQTNNLEEAVSIRTDYLSKEQESEPGANLIKGFDTQTMTMPDYKDVKIAFKVTEPNTSDRIIINTAEISNDSDEEGNPVDDIDSTPDNDKEKEDDIDIEKIKVKYFDLSLKKWVSESIVTYNGKTTVNKTGHTGDENPEPPAKVEIRGSRLSKTTVKFKFHIKVTNEGEIAGYAKELIDYIPEGLKFMQEDNPKWRQEDGKVLTDQLKDTLLQPGESATVEIILTWINNKNNLQEKVNWAEIYKDENEYGTPDIDSTPGNDKKGEDDIDRAPVVLSIVTGSTPTYIVLILASVSMIAGGVILIKKFVL